MAERLKITITTENAAFEEDTATELARILRDIAEQLESDGTLDGYSVRDINGNKCGHASIEPYSY